MKRNADIYIKSKQKKEKVNNTRQYYQFVQPIIKNDENLDRSEDFKCLYTIDSKESRMINRY